MEAQNRKVVYLIIGSSVSFNLILHLIGDCNAGFHGDELLHIEAGRHLAPGYMDFPPLIAFLAFFQNLFNSDSLFLNHLFIYVASALIIVLCNLITLELEGGKLAFILLNASIIFSPGIGASHSLFLPDIFDQLMWILCAYNLTRYCKNHDQKFILYLSIFAALGFLTKYTIVFLIAGVVISILLFQINILKKKSSWVAFILFLLFISPNILWQFFNGFPVFQHVSKLYETQLTQVSVFEELKSLILYANPLILVFWAMGLFVVPVIQSFRNYRMITVTLLCAFLFLFFAKGKSYYYFPVILATLPFGIVFIESFLLKRGWLVKGYLSLLFLSGILLLPNGIPLFPLNKYIKIYNLKENIDHEIPIPFENYYSTEIWKEILLKVNNTYTNLNPDEQVNCLIWGRHYSESSGINLFGKKFGLPKAFSFHSSCYSWVPDFSRNITVIAISDANLKMEYWKRFFDQVEEIGFVENHYTSDYKWYKQHIYLCRKLKYNSTELKNIFKDEIF